MSDLSSEPELREPDLPRTAKVRPTALRTGWTTGTCASAAAKAATTALRDQQVQDVVEVALPGGRRVTFAVDSCRYDARRATAVVVKDAGDDPDVTHGAHLTATVAWREEPGVVAVERDPQQCCRITANAARHGVDVQVVPGAAPGALDGLPAPDAAFVGGGGPDVVAAVAARVPARVVVALAAVDRVGPTRAALAGAGYAVDGVLLQASRLAPLPGDAHRLAATNPVFLLWAQRTAQPERERRQGERA